MAVYTLVIHLCMSVILLRTVSPLDSYFVDNVVRDIDGAVRSFGGGGGEGQREGR
jgi:hypothetical protein